LVRLGIDAADGAGRAQKQEDLMFRSLLIGLIATVMIASVASAAPPSLSKGHWSLGYSPDGAQEFLFGMGIADMTKIVVSASFDNDSPGDVVSAGGTTEFESNTSFGIGGALHYYLDGLSNEHFAPFLGGGFAYFDTGVDGEDGSFAFDGRFGGEAFAVEPLSIGGFVGVRYTKEGDRDGFQGGEPVTFEGDKSFSSFRSAIFANLYWGGK
jgi:hypothetical protein